MFTPEDSYQTIKKPELGTVVSAYNPSYSRRWKQESYGFKVMPCKGRGEICLKTK
jgi:hypothetical protein